ncbi:hypothetical protein KXS11_16820 [Plantibacter flavus]|uniref:hypothetical protein n=1 Tax=Plantibacter flavus TaxID=150123 RepID=UPI003F152CBA
MSPDPFASAPQPTPAGRFVEVWASPTVLMTFDGRVLEVFGFTDANRFHLAFSPVVTFSEKRAWMSVKMDVSGTLTFPYDAARRPELDGFAAIVAAAVAARDRA